MHRIPRPFSGLCRWGDCDPFSLRSRPCGSAAVRVTLLKPQFSEGRALQELGSPGLGLQQVVSGSLGRVLVRRRALAGGGSCQGAGPHQGGVPSSGGVSSPGTGPRPGAGPRGGRVLAGGGSQVRRSPDFADRPGQRPGGDAVCQAVGAGRPRCPGTAGRRRAARERQGGGKLSLQKPVTQRSARSSSA